LKLWFRFLLLNVFAGIFIVIWITWLKCWIDWWTRMNLISSWNLILKTDD
jgi:hypothetical protein